MKLCRIAHRSFENPCYVTAEALDSLRLDEVKMLAPVTPSKIVCVGRNYREHAAELGNKMPDEPLLFLKAPSAVIASGDRIELPSASHQVEHEGELGVVIGRTARFVPRDEALDHVAGYTIINDASARDFQMITSQWMAGKIFETAAPMGPYIADREEIPDPHVLDLKTFVNGKQMQRGNTKTLIFDVRYLVSYLSNLTTLSPGDVIATGTPPGVGLGMKPPVWLQPGDVCRMEITDLGVLENPVKDA